MINWWRSLQNQETSRRVKPYTPGKKHRCWFVRSPAYAFEREAKKGILTKFRKKVDIKELLADAVLPVIAAVYLDGGFEAVKKVVLNLGLFFEQKE